MEIDCHLNISQRFGRRGKRCNFGDLAKCTRVVCRAQSADEVLKAVAASPILSERLLGAVLNKADEAVMRRFEGYSDRHYTYYTNEKIPEETS